MLNARSASIVPGPNSSVNSEEEKPRCEATVCETQERQMKGGSTGMRGGRDGWRQVVPHFWGVGVRMRWVQRRSCVVEREE